MPTEAIVERTEFVLRGRFARIVRTADLVAEVGKGAAASIR
jgi:hypothetical protein